MKRSLLLKIPLLAVLIVSFSCGNSKKDQYLKEAYNQLEESKQAFQLTYDTTKVVKYTLAKVEDISNANSTKFSYSIVVSTQVTKEELTNTLKDVVARQTKKDDDIDEIIVFAFDNEKDIGTGPYTFGKLTWAPHGELGHMTEEIHNSNNRSKYDITIDIKAKVGNINPADVPTSREIAIYNEIFLPKYANLTDAQAEKEVMKKFKISKSEYDKIFLKVMKYKTDAN